jgi:hypothetical protein
MEGNMKVRMLFSFLMLWAVNIASQEFSIDVTPKKVKVLPGAPVSLSVTLTNDSHKDLWICGKELKNGIRSGGAILIDVAGQELNCTQSGESASSTGAFPNAPIKDKVLFGAGETFRMSSGIYADKACPLSRDLTGKWTARVAVKIMVVEGPLVKDIRYAQAVGEIEVEFQKPEGEDLAYINAVTEWLNKADPKTLRGYTAQAKPLTWGELLSSFRIPVPQMLLKNYPTATYASYVIYDRLKGFAGADFANPMFLRSLETGLFLSNSYPTENGWMEMKDEMNAAWWSKWAGIIIKNHPDIWFADELRLKLAMNQVALKNYQAAEADFIKLSKEAKPCIAEKAGLFVEIMKQKGWISAPVEKSVPEAKEEK